MDIWKILKAWYEFKAENEQLTGNHTDLLFYIIDLNNRLAWKEVFGLPSIETSQFLGISYNTFRKIFDDLVDLNLIRLVKRSKNQYSANQISIDVLCQNLLKQTKSTYKAFVKAQQKQIQSTCNIDIHTYNNTLLHLNNLESEINLLTQAHEKLKNENKLLEEKIKILELTPVDISTEKEKRKSEFKEKLKTALENLNLKMFSENSWAEARKFFEYWTESGENDKKMRFEKEKSFDIKRRLATWQERYEKEQIKIKNNGQKQFNNTGKPDYSAYERELFQRISGLSAQ